MEHKKHKSAGSESWVITFADLLSLLLTFFVLSFSMNIIDVSNWQTVVKTMSEEFNPERSKVSIEKTIDDEKMKKPDPVGLNVVYLATLLQMELANEPLLKGGRVASKVDRVVISLPASNLFGEKDAEKHEGIKEALSRIGMKLAQLKNRIVVTGHTDFTPVVNDKFRSNWELSLTRARVIAGILTETGYQNSITVLGYADTRYDEMDDSWTASDKRIFAERVDIVVIDKEKTRGPYDIF